MPTVSAGLIQSGLDAHIDQVAKDIVSVAEVELVSVAS